MRLATDWRTDWRTESPAWWRRVPGEVWTLAALALVALVVRLGTGLALAALGFACVLLLCLVSLGYWMAATRTQVETRRELTSAEVPYGTTLGQRITLTPRSRLVRWLMHWSVLTVTDQFAVPGLPETGLAGTIAGGEVVDEREAVISRRGIWQQGPTELTISAPLGLLHYVRPLAPAVRVTVYPPVVRLSRLAWDTDGYDGHVQATTRTTDPRARRHPPTTVGQRRYQPGDPLAQVNWAVIGPHGEHYTRQFARMARPGVLLVMDPDPATEDARRAAQRMDTLAAAAASLARRILAQPGHPAVALLTVTLSDDPAARIPPCRARGPEQLPVLLRRLAEVQPLVGTTAVRAMDRAFGQALVGMDTVIVLTCGNADRWPARLARARGSSARAGEAAHVRVVAVGASATPMDVAAHAGRSAGRGNIVQVGEDWGEQAHLPLLAAALQGA
jgi:uncharacterized protein (DUF58 family)